jgi:NAD+ synthase (glutamine-hydrolysing)
VPEGEEQRDARCREIINIQSEGLKRRLAHLGNAKAVIGISGGLDSTLALLVTVEAFDRLKLPRTNIYAITMPGFGTTSRTKTNADTLMRQLGVTALEISIAEAARQHLKDIDHSEEIHDATYENAQARERTQILMDYANKVGGIVIGTGDLSELALGWCTYNGDHMSMYGVNGSIPKTLVRHLVKWFVDVATDEDLKLALLDVLDTPVSPEPIPADSNDNIVQKTEDLVGPYELHDFFIYNYIRHGYSPNKIYRLALQAFAGEYPDDVIEKWLRTFMRRFYSQQFKRSCMPDGPKVGSVCFSPRGDWRMPSDV